MLRYRHRCLGVAVAGDSRTRFRRWATVDWPPSFFFFFSSRRRHTRSLCDWSSDVCSSDLSCVAVIIHDPVAMVGGLLHFMLPESSSDSLESGKSPYMFADTGIPLLFREAYQMGAEKRRLRVHLTGGARMIGENDVFQIGARNCLAAHRILWEASVIPTSEQTGGACARTVR